MLTYAVSHTYGNAQSGTLASAIHFVGQRSLGSYFAALWPAGSAKSTFYWNDKLAQLALYAQSAD